MTRDKGIGRLRIVTDGTRAGTKVLDAATGEPVNFLVSEVTIHMTPLGIKAVLTTPIVAVDVVVDDVQVDEEAQP